jgi:hypothetical protein
MSFTDDRGRDAGRFFEELERVSQPTVGDLLYAGNGLKSRILLRTERGVDFQGRPFAPYSSSRPYYYYPSRGAKYRKAAVSRQFKKVLAGKRTSVGIKYDGGYAEFKLRGLGRSNVDLRGPKAPHMLQAIVVTSDGVRLAVQARRTNAFTTGNGGGTQNQQPPLNSDPQPARQLIIGIYGDEADRAEGHNEGTGSLPRRRFFDASDRDIELMQEDIADRIEARWGRL